MELSERVIELLAKSDPMRQNEIAQVLNIEKKDLEKVLKQLKNDSNIIKKNKTIFFNINLYKRTFK